MQLLWLLFTAVLCSSAISSLQSHQSTHILLPEPARQISNLTRCLRVRGGSSSCVLVAKPDQISSVRVQRTPEWLRRLGIPFTQVRTLLNIKSISPTACQPAKACHNHSELLTFGSKVSVKLTRLVLVSRCSLYQVLRIIRALLSHATRIHRHGSNTSAHLAPRARVPPEKVWMIDELRAQVRAVPRLEQRAKAVGHELDDTMLIRFLEGAFWSLEHKGVPLIGLLQDTITWREQYGANSIRPADLGVIGSYYRRGHTTDANSAKLVGPLAPVLAGGAMVVHGRDALDRPVLYMKLSALFVDGYSTEHSMKLAVYSLERAWRSRLRGVEAYTIVVDCRGFGLRNLPPLGFFKSIWGSLSRHYPMRLGHIVMCNVSSSASVCWRVVAPIIPARTKDKVVFVAENKPQQVHRYVPKAQLLQTLGGSNSYVYEPFHYFSEPHA
eukprot:1538-Heterococcus_DN1.PRE.1